MINRITQKQNVMMFFLLFISSLHIFSVQAFFAENFFEQKNAQGMDKVAEEKSITPVKFKARTDHSFLLSADYHYIGKEIDKDKSSGVIVLHDCHSDRSQYSELASTIAAQGLHVLSLDARGYGGSVSKSFSELAIKRNAKDIVSYQNDIALITSYWADDLLAAYQFLRSKVEKSKGIAVVASGCSTNYAVSLAETIHINAMVFITPEMSYAEKERYKNLTDIPTYFISSAHHLATYSTAQELFAWNGAAYSKIQTFKGNRRERQLLNAELNLVNDVAQWLKFNLR
jgi:hypothetical protein